MTVGWIALDWAADRQRVWAMQGGDIVSETAHEGGLTVTPQGLISLISDWLSDKPLPVIACGLLGPVSGTIPCAPLADGAWSMDLGDPRVDLHVIPGLKQKTPVDMMQGDETRVAGFLALNKDWDGVLCLVGSETRWVHVSAGEVVSFQTFMTGAVLGALAAQTGLHQWLNSPDLEVAAFDAALSDAMAKPERILARLYSIHAEGVLDGLSQGQARGRILGGLIGAELAAARPFWLGQQLAVIGQGAMAQAYVDALGAQGAPATLADEPRITRQGLQVAWRALST